MMGLDSGLVGRVCREGEPHQSWLLLWTEFWGGCSPARSPGAFQPHPQCLARSPPSQFCPWPHSVGNISSSADFTVQEPGLPRTQAPAQAGPCQHRGGGGGGQDDPWRNHAGIGGSTRSPKAPSTASLEEQREGVAINKHPVHPKWGKGRSCSDRRVQRLQWRPRQPQSRGASPAKG